MRISRRAIIVIVVGMLLGHRVAAQTEAKPDAWPESVWNAEIASVDGSSYFRLADYSGEVLVIYTWAAWCAPCRIISPVINELGEEYAGRGVEVIGLVVGDPESEAKDSLAFIQKFKHRFKSGWMDKAMTEAVLGDSQDSRNNVVPQFLVITSYGYLFKKIRGFDPAQTPELLHETIEEALANPSLAQ
jgi:thiol-disulfide isomerase/thioredoxin